MDIRRPLVLVLIIAAAAHAWDDGDFEVFDAVEEINQNFYQFMGIEQVHEYVKIFVEFGCLVFKLLTIQYKIYNMDYKQFFNVNYCTIWH